MKVQFCIKFFLKMLHIGLILLLAGLHSGKAELTKTEEIKILDIYGKQVCLNYTFLNYWKLMVETYENETRERNKPVDYSIKDFRYPTAKIIDFFSLLNDQYLSIELNIVSWACYIFYKEALNPPEIKKAEKCQQFARFLAWYNRLFKLDSAFSAGGYPGATYSLTSKKYMYGTEEIVAQMRKLSKNLGQMNDKLLADDDSTNIFEKLREQTTYYGSKNDVIPITELLSDRQYGDVTDSSKFDSSAMEFSTFVSLFRKSEEQDTENEEESSPKLYLPILKLSSFKLLFNLPEEKDKKYQEDYHDEIYRRLWLFLGPRSLTLNHYLRAFLGTTIKKNISYIENLTPPLSLSKMYWKYIENFKTPTQPDLNVVERVISMKVNFFDIFLKYMDVKIPKKMNEYFCFVKYQYNYVQYTLKMHSK